MLDSGTKKKIDDLRQILVGKITNPQSQVEQITTGLIYKFMNDMDKEAVEMGGVPSFFVGEFEKYAWKHLFNPKLLGVEKVKLYSDAIENMYTNPNAPAIFREIFKNSFLPFKDASILNLFLKEINEFHYSNSEKLGDAYEYLLSFMGSQGDAGQFRTPRHIIDFIIQIVNPQKHETILDPACGTSGFLISSYKHILNQNTQTRIGDKLNASERKQIGENLVGYDIDPAMSRISLVNMYLHNFTSPNISEYDTLSSEEKWNEYFDVILANPPFFSPTGGIKPHSRFGIKSTRAEVLFVDYIMEHLKPNGRAGIIVPEGIIFQTGNAYKKLRQKLVEDYLVGVISLPMGVFQPYSGVKTSILILDKQNNQRSESIFFAKVENDGFSLGAQRKPISKNDLTHVLDGIKKRKPNNHLDFILKETIEKNDFLLTNSIYKSDETENSIFPLSSLGDLCEIQSGGTPSKKSQEYWLNGTILWVGSAVCRNEKIYKSDNFITESGLANSSAKIFPVGTTLIALVGATIGKTALCTFQTATNQNIAGLIPKNPSQLSNIYLFHAVNNLYKHFQKLGDKQFRMANLGFIKKLEIPLPPLNIQNQIIKEIECYEKIIEGCKQVIKNYKPIINVDPAWEIFEIGEICEFAYGKGLKENERIEGDYDVFGSNGVVGSHNSFLVKHPFIIIGRKGSAGKVHLSTKNGFPIDTTFYISPKQIKSSQVSLNFLFYSLKNIDLGKASSDQTIPGLNRNDAYKKKIAIPNLEIQKKIVMQIQEEEKLIKNNWQLIKLFQQKISDRMSNIWGK